MATSLVNSGITSGKFTFQNQTMKKNFGTLLAYSSNVDVETNATEIISVSDSNSNILDLQGYDDFIVYVYNNTGKDVTVSVFTAPSGSATVTEANILANPRSAAYLWGLEGTAFAVTNGTASAPKKYKATGRFLSLSATVGTGTSGDGLEVTVMGIQR